MTVPAGARLFARYAYAPNDLGFCGPAQSRALFDVAATGAGADVAPLARRFSGAWPYLQLLAELAGIADPLDERVVRAYWTGSPLLETVDRRAFGERLLERLGAQAGHYWRHLTPELLPEAAPTHGFHVFGVYPWSRLLGAEAAGGQPLVVLDNCRIRWGRMLRRDGDHVVVSSRRLVWDGHRIDLAPPRPERVRLLQAGAGFVPDPQPGQWLALHWDWVCERLTPARLAPLRRWSRWQLEVTNRRLAATPVAATPVAGR